jgi:hypothetical protein
LNCICTLLSIPQAAITVLFLCDGFQRFYLYNELMPILGEITQYCNLGDQKKKKFNSWRVGGEYIQICCDIVRWDLNKNGEFSSEYLYNFLNPGVRDQKMMDMWGVNLPPENFQWLRFREQIQYVSQLSTKGWPGSNLCVLCGSRRGRAHHVQCPQRFYVTGFRDSMCHALITPGESRRVHPNLLTCERFKHPRSSHI